MKDTRYLTAHHALRICDVLRPSRYEKREARDARFIMDRSSDELEVGTFLSDLHVTDCQRQQCIYVGIAAVSSVEPECYLGSICRAAGRSAQADL